MANADAPFGLRPSRHLNGNPWNGQTVKMLVEDSYAVAIFRGDPIIITGTAGSDDATGHYQVANVATAGDTNRLAGVCTSVVVDEGELYRAGNYLPASTGGYINVCIDPDVVYQIQDDGGAVLDSGSLGANAILASGTGSTITGLSGWELAAATTPAADASYQMQILAIANQPDNALGINCIWEVLLSNHWLRGGQAAADEGALGI